MQKIIAIFSFLGLLTLGFCSSGVMANVLEQGSMEHTMASECCEGQTIAHHTEEIAAVIMEFNTYTPVALLILVFTVLFVYRERYLFQGVYSHYNFHKFSQGVFQLE